MENWKTIDGYQGYQISDLGKVKSLKGIRERILNPYLDANGYLMVGLSLNGKTKRQTVHQLVAIAFLNHKPCGHKLVVDHINGWKIDNRLDNLQIVTQKFNVNKSIKMLNEITTRPFTAEINKYLTWSIKLNKWILLLRRKGKQIYLGYFDNEIEASQTYQNALKQL